MFSFTFSTKPFLERLAALQIRIGQLPDAMHNAMQGQQGQLANDALRKLTMIPGAPVHPIRWKSARQRKAFFASDGFGKGIPTQRTYKLLQGWHVVYVRSGDGGVLSLTNDEPYMRFVQGSDAQPFHLDTGWIQRSDVVDDFVRESSQQVVTTWFGVASAAVVEVKP